ncbi:MAG: hypothetical protein NTV77_02950 [Candidatus Azambacteria bacterium]|nr:hypothetical protein [Candidatus Azambacteria bacterium]
MKIKYLISFIIINLALVGSVILVNKIFAQGTTRAQNIQYPVKELGSCKDESACKSYCDKSENTKSCVNFAEKNNLMSKEEIEMAKKFMATGSKGPGGCRGKDECDAYCNDIAHIDECVAFAVENNLMPPGELEEAKKVQAAIKRGVKPPPCGNKKQCDVYCEDPNHMEECITFGVEAGFIQGKELEDVQKMLAAVKRGIKPPPCKGKEACDTYCGDPNNIEMCMTFAMEAGFMSEQEKADSQKMLQALKKGIKPPNCRGKDECDAYCSQDQHFDECTKFAEAAGFMTPEGAAMARKTGGKGPGNCKGKDECDAFCNNPDNQETCFNFAKENGMISETDLKQMGEGKQKFQESLQQAPATVLDCLNSEIGTDMMEKFKSGAAMPPREIGDKMRGCFEKMGPPRPEGQGESDQKFQPGPGSANPGGQTMPQQAGPGGCKGPEECKSYCESHPDECKNSEQRVECQGENCLPPPPPSNQPGGSPEFPQLPTNMQPPAGLQPPIEPQPPVNNIAPPPLPPSEIPAPPPSSSIAPESQLGSLLDIFLFMFK